MELLQLHCLIFTTLFLPGTMVCYLLRSRLAPVLALDFVAALLAFGFAFSLGINLLLGAWVSLTGMGFALLPGLWIMVNLGLLLAAWQSYRKSPDAMPTHPGLWLVVVSCFAVMVQNGGLVSLVADSWWHMGLVNQILESETLFVERHHFSGLPQSTLDFSYEPGWHFNLALLLTMARFPEPLLWHALAPWCVSITLLTYYLFAVRLLDDRRMALLAIVLLALLMGGINSYFRVSPWPGNVAYALMYLTLCIVFTLSDTLRWPANRQGWQRLNSLAALPRAWADARVMLMCLLWMVAIIAIIHLAELFWLLVALVWYSLALYMLGDRVGKQRPQLYQDDALLTGLWWWFFLAWAAFSLYRSWALAPMVSMVGLALVLVVVTARISAAMTRPLTTSAVAALMSLVLAALYIDSTHLAELFDPRPGPDYNYYDSYIPGVLFGYFGEQLRLPQWEHQLRAGLLCNGILGVVLAAPAMLYRLNRATVFLAATAICSFLVLITPYLFTFFVALVPETGVYRFQILIFHPMILAFAIVAASDEIVTKSAGTRVT